MLAEDNPIPLLFYDLKGLNIQYWRHIPVIQIKRISPLEEDGELPAFRTHPETVLAAEYVDVLLNL